MVGSRRPRDLSYPLVAGNVADIRSSMTRLEHHIFIVESSHTDHHTFLDPVASAFILDDEKKDAENTAEARWRVGKARIIYCSRPSSETSLANAKPASPIGHRKTINCTFFRVAALHTLLEKSTLLHCGTVAFRACPYMTPSGKRFNCSVPTYRPRRSVSAVQRTQEALQLSLSQTYLISQ